MRVICARGYKLNIGTNNTAKCVRGKWKPRLPDCEISKLSMVMMLSVYCAYRLTLFYFIAVSCKIPHSDNGVYNWHSIQGISPEKSVVTEDTDFVDGDIVNFTCNTGFNIKGPPSFTCILGEWDISMFPECTPG